MIKLYNIHTTKYYLAMKERNQSLTHATWRVSEALSRGKEAASEGHRLHDSVYVMFFNYKITKTEQISKVAGWWEGGQTWQQEWWESEPTATGQFCVVAAGLVVRLHTTRWTMHPRQSLILVCAIVTLGCSWMTQTQDLSVQPLQLPEKNLGNYFKI